MCVWCWAAGLKAIAGGGLGVWFVSQVGRVSGGGLCPMWKGNGNCFLGLCDASTQKSCGFFIFIFFYFRFLQKYIFDLEIYKSIPGRPAAGRPGPAAGRQSLIRPKKTKKIANRSLGTQYRAAGRAAPLGGRLYHPI